MIREEAEVAIIGTGFGGTLMALILQRIGLKPLLIEKGTHPRFAIGESSTPLANLAFAHLCRAYDLPRLLPLSKYGSWHKTYPEIACGLKRGFSFFKHHPNQCFQPRPDHANELLVAASRRDEIGDTHWFRADFDHFLVQEAQAADIPYFDRTQVSPIEQRQGWLLRGKRQDEEIEVKVRFLIDASGPTSVLMRTLGIDCSPQGLRTRSWTVFSHFADVALWEGRLADAGGDVEGHPFHCDDAALHHVLDDGWIWMLRFNNGLTSAGVVMNSEEKAPTHAPSPEMVWQQTLSQFPSIANQFAGAEAVRPFTHIGRLQRRARLTAGKNWVILPHTAYFIDPLLSTGIARTLLGIERLARIFEAHWGRSSMASQLRNYHTILQREVGFVDQLVHGLQRSFRHFDLFVAYSMYYFAGATFSEHRFSKGIASYQDEFLFSHHVPFRTAVSRGYKTLLELSKRQHIPSDLTTAFAKRVAEDIKGYNIAGLCDPGKKNMYPYQ